MDSIKIYKCRLCLNNTSKKVDIFKQDFPKMIELLTGLKVDPNDGLSKESCLDCAKDVKFCMSVRKQILQSYKSLLKDYLEKEPSHGQIKLDSLETRRKSADENVSIEKKTPRKNLSKRFKKREIALDDSSDEEFHNSNYSEYSDSESDDEIKNPDKAEITGNIDEQIPDNVEFKMEDVSQILEIPNGKFDENENSKTEMKTENNSIDNIPPAPVTPFSPQQRLLRKRNMIAASNKILKQEKTMADRRYSNIVFIRKSMKEKMKIREEKNVAKFKKKEKSEDPNIIMKNGKKYAACTICKREVKMHYLKHHMATHFPEHYSCDVCGVTTRNMRGLRYHKLYWHSSKLDYICDKCGKKYRSKHALDLHTKKEHGGVRDLECTICGKKFFQKMHLKRHIDGIHKKLRPHKCEYCGKDFSKRTHLVTHWRTHTNETPYGCDMCGERFKLKLSLKNHLRRAHNFEEKERVFCDICNRGFASEQGLRAHINSRIHEGEKCQYCSESFTPEYLKVHLREVHFHVDFE